MPLYEFNNKETGESAGEIYLSLDKLDSFLERNPQLCIKPGKLRYAVHKSADSLSFPSYPDMDNETRTKEETGENWKPPSPASWNDSDEDSGNRGYKVVDKRAYKVSHFDEDIKKYGKIVGTPKMLGSSETNFGYDSVDSNEPISLEEEEQQYEIESKKDKQGTWERESLGQKGWKSTDPIELSDSQEKMPWEAGFAKENKHMYDQSAVEDNKRRNADRLRERVKLGLEDPDED